MKDRKVASIVEQKPDSAGNTSVHGNTNESKGDRKSEGQLNILNLFQDKQNEGKFQNNFEKYEIFKSNMKIDSEGNSDEVQLDFEDNENKKFKNQVDFYN